MYLYKSLFLICFIALSTFVKGQDNGLEVLEKESVKDQHEFYFYWGYNRSAYLTSDIRMVGNGYDFTMHDVVAKDKPYPFDAKVYFNPVLFSIPQFNIRAGYKLNDRIWLSAGYDHMKYVLQNGMSTTISGTITKDASSKYAGTYDHDSIVLATDFVQYEHTDGLNFGTFDLEYITPIWESKNHNFKLNNLSGGSLGILVPRTDVTIFNYDGPNIFNLAGGGLAIKTQMKFLMWNHLFIQGSGKAGWLWMPKIQTTKLPGEWSRQNISFIEAFWAVGYQWKL
ncbi:MAG: hypothetical protein ACI9N1_001423 [Flavobacteriales bacterium]|jgi:hypothetical protein